MQSVKMMVVGSEIGFLTTMLGALVIGIPLLIYVIGALSVAKKDLKHPDDFFVAFKKVGITAFSSSSIAYAFQVSTVYPFLLWAAQSHFVVPAVNAVCWGLGILLFYFCFNRYKQFIGQDVTLHGFLGKQYGNSVRVVASYLTIIGFLGYAVAETYFGSKVLLSVVENKNAFYLVVTLSLLFVFGYIAYGGQVSSMRTDQLQLIISYAGVFGIMLYLFYLLFANGVKTPGVLSVSFAVLLVYVPVVLTLRKGRFIRISEEDSRTNRIINTLLNSTIVVLLALILLFSLYKVILGADFKPFVPQATNLEGFGVAGLVSLILLPLCWQFVDLTNWQRLLAVKPDHENDVENLQQNIRKGLLIYAIESPFTWVIFLFFGLLAVSALPHFTFNDLLIDIPRQLITSTSLGQRVAGYTFIVSVLAIMLSTVDSFIIGIMFTFVYDSYPKTRRVLDSANEQKKRESSTSILNAGRLFGFAVILFGILAFVFFDIHVANGGELFINLLLAFYSAQLSFFPLVIGILFLKRHPSTFWANASMVVGAVSGISLGIYAVIRNQDLIWYPVLVCLFSSTVVYLLGWLITNNASLNGAVNAGGKVIGRVLTRVRKNRVSVGLFFVFVALSMTRMFGWSHRQRWKDWETCALLFTLCYTANVYLKNWSRFQQVMGWKAMFLGAAPIALAVTATLSANDYLQLFKGDLNRPRIMLALTLTALLFVLMDVILVNALSGQYPRESERFRQALNFSDLPILFAFILLATYAYLLDINDNGHDNMDAFFGGAIAFQMLISNIVWVLTDSQVDDPVQTATTSNQTIKS